MERLKRPRDDSDPWNVAWPSDIHRREEVLGDNKVVINWMNGAWEVKGDEHAFPVRGVVDQFVWCFLGVLSGRELTRLIGVSTFSESVTKLWILMNTG